MNEKRLSVELKQHCMSIWKKPWAKRRGRVSLVVVLDNRFAIGRIPPSGFWFLPGGGIEEDESIEQAAKREAQEELGLEIEIQRILGAFRITLVCTETGEQVETLPFISILATPTGGKLQNEYAPQRRVHLVRLDDIHKLLQYEIPTQWECRKPYLEVSKETLREAQVFLSEGIDR